MVWYTTAVSTIMATASRRNTRNSSADRRGRSASSSAVTMTTRFDWMVK